MRTMIGATPSQDHVRDRRQASSLIDDKVWGRMPNQKLDLPSVRLFRMAYSVTRRHLHTSEFPTAERDETSVKVS